MFHQDPDNENIFIYDDVSYHIEGNWPEDLELKQAYVHTGFYIGWLIDADLVSQLFKDDFGNEIRLFKNREITGPELYQKIDRRFASDMLNDDGNAFTNYYFDFEQGQYLNDYGHLLANICPSAYHVEDTWEHYKRIAKRIQEQHDYWLRHPPA